MLDGMFFTVKSGAGDAQIFNADCMARQLVESISRRCQCKPGDKLAVVDEECSFAVISVSGMSSSTQNGCSLFRDREVYVLLVVTRDEKTKEDIYTPLLDEDYIEPEFSVKLGLLTSRGRRLSVRSFDDSQWKKVRKKLKSRKTVQQF